METILLSIKSLVSGSFTLLANITLPSLILYLIIRIAIKGAIKEAIKELKKENIL